MLLNLNMAFRYFPPTMAVHEKLFSSYYYGTWEAESIDSQYLPSTSYTVLVLSSKAVNTTTDSRIFSTLH